MYNLKGIRQNLHKKEFSKMKLKKLAAIVLTAIMAISALGITAFAAAPIGTNPTTLTDGKQKTVLITFNGERGYDTGNFADFKYTAASDGTLNIKITSETRVFWISVYNSDMQEIERAGSEDKTGEYNSYEKLYGWDSNAGLYSGTIKYKVKKGTYYIRIGRDVWNVKGSGKVRITCELDLPKAPTNIKVSNITGTSAKFTWTEPKGGTAYDLRYRVKGTEKWTVKKDIDGNSVTIKNLKASKTYEYQMRTYSGKSVGNWGKTGTFKSTGAAYKGKLGVPSAKKVTIEWGAVSNALKYEIRYKAGNGNWTTKTVSGNSYTISVSAGKTYTYQIRAVNGNNKGDWSASKTISA